MDTPVRPARDGTGGQWSGFARRAPIRQTSGSTRSGPVLIDTGISPWLYLLSGLLLAASLLVIPVLLRQRRNQRRRRVVGNLLDLADDMERLLHRLRNRMQRVQGVVERVPADIGANAHASLERDDLIELALKDLLEHRLWIQRHSEDAAEDELQRALQALTASFSRIQREMDRLERAGRALERAADAVAAETSPAEPRRNPPAQP